MSTIKTLKKDKLKVIICETRDEIGAAAADDIAACIEKLLKEKETVNMIFAAAPSQNEMLMNLAKKKLPWGRINAFHMDEYVGLDKNHPQSFGKYLYDHIFGLVDFASVKYISDYGEKYGEFLEKNHIDIICLGIGENGHIAFNDPGVADFNDPKLIKEVKLDDVCRMQQVHDGCFKTFDDVPESAFTITVPAMFAASHLFCVVPASTKAEAVFRTVNDGINENCPATIMRNHGSAVMYCDKDSGIKII